VAINDGDDDDDTESLRTIDSEGERVAPSSNDAAAPSLVIVVVTTAPSRAIMDRNPILTIFVVYVDGWNRAPAFDDERCWVFCAVSLFRATNVASVPHALGRRLGLVMERPARASSRQSQLFRR
jgi:hypothetical protein